MNSLSMSHFIIAAIVACLLYGGAKSFLSGFNGTDALFCTSCGHEGEPRMHTKGSMGIELVLWLLLIVPGLIYSVWRMSSKAQVCASCGAATLVPGTSPVAVKMRKDLNLGPAVALNVAGPSGERA